MKSSDSLPKAVRAVIQFGSTARGDQDVYSDRDICVIVAEVSDARIRSLKRRLAAKYRTDEQSVSAYRLSTVRQMARNGSLFLWHLKLEGRVLDERSRTMRRILESLRQYRGYSEDLLRFQEVFDDTAHEFTRSKRLDLFDLHALFIVVRNVCMLLTVKDGHPTFGRSAVHSSVVRQHGRVPITARLYSQLAACHLAYLRGADVEVIRPSRSESWSILRQVSAFLKMAWRRVE